MHAMALSSDLSSEEDLPFTAGATSQDLGEDLDDAVIENDNIVCDDQQYDSDSDGSEMGTSSSDESSDLSTDLAKWAVKNKATRTSVDKLLSVLRKHEHRLPKDARTLLRTPRQVEAQELCGGQYLYFVLESGILKICSQYPDEFSRESDVVLNFNIDGLPLFKTSNVEIWPILCSVKRFQPFIVAIYCGSEKPNSVSDFMSDFLEELIRLQQDRIAFQGGNITVKVNAFICDAPARAFLKCIKGHKAYYSCERCTIERQYVNHRVVYNYQSQEMISQRTDEEFSRQSYASHQSGRLPLVDAGLQCVQSFVLDYMHLVCLGVVRRVLVFLKQGPREC